MANVQVIQRHAYLAGSVKLERVNGREGEIAKAVLVAISNSRRGRRGPDDRREDESVAIRWTLWGVQAENAAQYLRMGSHVNIVGRLRNDDYRNAEGTMVYALTFTADEIDYLDSRADAEARRARYADEDEEQHGTDELPGARRVRRSRRARNGGSSDASGS